MDNVSENINITNILNIFSNIGNDIARQIVSFIPVENNRQLVFEYLTQNIQNPPNSDMFDYLDETTINRGNKNNLLLSHRIKIFLEGFYKADNIQTQNIINILESYKCKYILLEYKNYIGNMTIKESIEILTKITYYIKKNKLDKIKQSNGLINGIRNIIEDYKNNTKKVSTKWFKKLLLFMGLYAGLCNKLLYILSNNKKVTDFFNYLIKKSKKSLLPISSDEENIYKEVILSDYFSNSLNIFQ